MSIYVTHQTIESNIYYYVEVYCGKKRMYCGSINKDESWEKVLELLTKCLQARIRKIIHRIDNLPKEVAIQKEKILRDAAYRNPELYNEGSLAFEVRINSVPPVG